MRPRRILTFREQKAQVGVEYIIIVGLLLSMILIVYPYALKQNELNKALAAARDGAVYGASLRGMGFRGEGVKEAPEGIIKIVKIEVVNLNTINPTTGKPEYRFDIYISAPDYIKNDENFRDTVGRTITTQARRYICRAFNGYWPTGADVAITETTGSYYTFRVSARKELWV